jgi:hypothetical protein
MTNDRNEIVVFLYSYKNKNLYEYVTDLIQKAENKTTIKIKIYDQNNSMRNSQFNGMHKVEYNFIRWEDYCGPNHYRILSLLDKSDYFLSLSDNVVLKESWDKDLIALASNNKVVSMFGKEKISHDTFFINVEREYSEEISLSNMVDTDLLFMPSHLGFIFKECDMFKVLGLNEAISIKLNNLKIEILSLPSSTVTKTKEKSPIEYIPYSKTHNYSKFYDLLGQESSKAFCTKIGVSVQNMKRYPYEMNDVLYSSPISSLDQKPGGEKFHSDYRTITFKQKGKKYV